MVYKKEELKNKTIMDNNKDNNSTNNKGPDNKDNDKSKNNKNNKNKNKNKNNNKNKYKKKKTNNDNKNKNKNNAENKNKNINLDDLCWEVGNITYMYKQEEVCEYKNKKIFYAIDSKKFENMDPCILEKFKKASENSNNVKFIYSGKNLILIELKIGKFDGRMVAKTRYSKTLNDNKKEFYLYVFNEISDHQKIKSDRSKIQTIDLSKKKT
jgi:hypothetical protein